MTTRGSPRWSISSSRCSGWRRRHSCRSRNTRTSSRQPSRFTTSYPGASAETIARTVATPLEQAINGVESMDYISSQSTGNGQLTITVIFKIGTEYQHGPHAHAQPRAGHVVPAAPGGPAPGRAGQEDHPGLASRRPSLFTGRIPQCRIHLELHDSSCQRRDRAASGRGGFLDLGRAAIRHADLDRSGQGCRERYQRQRYPECPACPERPGVGRRPQPAACLQQLGRAPTRSTSKHLAD